MRVFLLLFFNSSALQRSFVTIVEIGEENISYIQEGKLSTITKEEFNKLWTGNVLAVELTELSKEPDYIKQKIDNIPFNTKLRIIIFLTFFALTAMSICSTQITPCFSQPPNIHPLLNHDEQ